MQQDVGKLLFYLWVREALGESKEADEKEGKAWAAATTSNLVVCLLCISQSAVRCCVETGMENIIPDLK